MWHLYLASAIYNTMSHTLIVRRYVLSVVCIMASASSTSARSLFVDSKLRLADRVQVNVNNIASVARQIQRGARSNEVGV